MVALVNPATYPAGSLLHGYQLRLPSFEGPLDVLLRLVERSQLDITEISLVAVTDQFLIHVRGLAAVAPDAIAEFVAVAGRLVLLKSRSLLPRPPAADDDGEPDDLITQLVEYRAVKEAARLLGAKDERGDGAFARASAAVEAPAAAAPPPLALHASSSLARALRRRLSAVPSPAAEIAHRPLLTLREMVERVLRVVRGGEPEAVAFSRIRRGCRDRHEVLTAFLAVLVLVRRRVLDAEQTELFGEIALRATDTASSTDPEVAGAGMPAIATD